MPRGILLREYHVKIYEREPLNERGWERMQSALGDDAEDEIVHAIRGISHLPRDEDGMALVEVVVQEIQNA